MVLIVICVAVGLMAVLHVCLRRWVLREQTRVAMQRPTTASSPSIATPDLDGDEKRNEIRVQRMLYELSADIARRGLS